jgi:RND family efflux transporter MFP subunit
MVMSRKVFEKKALVVMLAAASLACGHEEPAPSNAVEPAVVIEAVDARVEEVADLYEAVGTVSSRLQASIAAKVTAVIDRVEARAGDRVEAGAVLARLDDREARARYAAARADYERTRALHADAAATRAELETAEARYRVAEARLGDTRIVAPFDGIVTEKLCDVGDMATPGTPLFSLEQPERLRLEVALPEREAGSVSVGETTTVVLDSTRERCPAVVSEIVPIADPRTRSVLVKIDLECASAVRSGGFASARLPVGSRSIVSVPAASVHERGQLTFVWVVADGRARMRLVKAARSARERVEILSGLEGGERVVVRAEGAIDDDTRVVER